MSTSPLRETLLLEVEWFQLLTLIKYNDSGSGDKKILGLISSFKELKLSKILTEDIRKELEKLEGVDFSTCIDGISKIKTETGIADDSIDGFLESMLQSGDTVNSAQEAFDAYRKYVKETGKVIDWAALKTKLLSSGVKLLSGALWTAGITLASWAAGKAFEWLDENVIHRIEHMEEAVENSASAHQDAASEVKSLNTELSTTNERIEELERKDALTFVEEQELQKLKNVTTELQAQLTLMEEQERKTKETYLKNQKKLYDEKYDTGVQTRLKEKQYGIIDVDLEDYSIRDMVAGANALLEASGTINEYGSVIDFTEDVTIALENSKEEYETYKADVIKTMDELYKELGEEAFETDFYKTLRSDLIDAARLFGDNVTLSNYVFTNDDMQQIQSKIIEHFTNGGTIDEVRDAIGESMYKSFAAACADMGIPVADMLTNMYAEATENIDEDLLRNMMIANIQAISRAEKGNWNTQKELYEYTDRLTASQKQLWIEVTAGAASATEAIGKFEQAYYADNRDKYISDKFINTRIPTAQDNQFYNLVKSLTDEDFQILLSLNLDATVPVEDIKQKIRDSKDEIDSILESVYSTDEEGEAITIEDEVGNVKEACDEIKGYIDDLNENGFEKLSSDAITAIEKITPGFSEHLSNAENKTTAAIEFLTQALGEQDDALISHLEYLMGLENLSTSAYSYIQAVINALAQDTQHTKEVDYDNLLPKYQAGAQFDDLFYTFKDDEAISYADAIDTVTSRISDLASAHQQLLEYQLQYGEASNDIDSAEFTKFVTDLIAKFPELALYTDGTVESLDSLSAAVSRMAGMEPDSLISSLEQLRDSEGVTAEFRHQIDLLIDSLNNLSNINISMDTTKDVIADMRQEMQNLAEFIYTINTSGLTLNVEDAQKYLDLYPELLQNAQLYADGTVKLNEGIVDEFIRGKEAEIQADGEARITELENERAILEVKRQYAMLKMQTALEALQAETEADAAAGLQKLENLETEEQAEITAKQNELEANANYSTYVAQNSGTLTDKMATDAETQSANVDSAAADIADSYAVNFANAQVSVNGLTNSFNALNRAMAGEIVAIPGISVSAGSRSGGITATKSTKASSPLFNRGNVLDQSFDWIDDYKNILETEAGQLTSQLVTQYNSALKDYNTYTSSIGEIDKQIAMIQANGGLSVKDYVGNLVNGLAQEAAEKAGGGKKGTGSGGTSGTKETFDWIETAIKRIEYGIESLDKIAGNTYNKFGTRNEALRNQLEQTRNEIDLQSQAYLRYMAEAESVGLSSYWKNKVQRGEVNIETLTNETLIEQINAYTEWYEKAQDAHASLMDLSQTVSDLYKESFDLIATEFDAMLSDIENRSNMLDAYITRVEERGYLVSTKYYKELLDNEQKNITLLQQEYSALQSSLAEAVASGAVKEGSESWYEMKASIDEVALSIQEAVNQTIEYNNAIRDIEWEVFDFLQEQISGITNEADFLIDLMSNSDMYDDKGNITDEGLATMGMHGVNYNTYMEQARQYEEEMLRIQDELANDPNNTVLIERKNELLELQRESILAAEDEKQAIKDLVSEGIEKELEAVKKLIDTYTESLDSAKDLYDYQKNIEEQVENIASLQKQYEAYQGDNSEENRANLQQIKNELLEAQENLEETEYERYISDQKQLLDELYTEYETVLNMRLDDLDALIAACVDGINTNASSIDQTLKDVSGKVGYDLSESMKIIFGTEGILGTNGAIATTITTFSGDFATRMTTLQTAIDAILNTVKSMIAETDEEASVDIAETDTALSVTPESSVGTTTPGTSTTIPSTSGTSNSTGTSGLGNGDGTPKVGDVVTYTGQYMYSAVGTSPVGSLYSGKENGVVIKQIQPDSKWYHPTHPYLIGPADKPNGVFGWVSLDQLRGYKTGVFNISENELAMVNEGHRKELIINPDGSMRMPDGSLLTPLAKGSSVLNAAATENFYKFANNPANFLQDFVGGMSTTAPPTSNTNSEIHNEIHVSCVFPNVATYEEFMYKLQHDTKAEKMIQDITLGVISGQSSLNKYRHNYKL